MNFDCTTASPATAPFVATDDGSRWKFEAR